MRQGCRAVRYRQCMDERNGYSELAGEGKGNNGEIIIAPLPDFPYLRMKKQ